MNKNWENIKNTADQLGDNLDVSAAWERFDKRDDRKRLLFWLWPSIGFLFFIVASFIIFRHSNITSIEAIQEETASDIITTPYVNIEEPKSVALSQTKNSRVSSEAITNKEVVKQQRALNNNRNNKTETNSNKIAQPSRKLKSSNQVKNSIQQPLKENNTVNYFMGNSIIKPLKPEIQGNNSSPSYDDRIVSDFDLLNVIVRPVVYNSKKIVFANDSYAFLTTKLLKNPSIQKPSWGYGLSYSYAIASRTIALSDTDFADRRRDNEDFLNANNLDFSVTRILNDQWSLSTGISIGHYRSRTFEVTQELESDILFENVIVERQLQAGNVVDLIGNVIGSRTIITERTRHQNYINLSVPISINYHLNLNRKWSVILSSGVSYSLLHKNDGSTFKSSFSVGEYEQVNNLQYRESGLLQGLASLRFSYHMKENIFIIGGLNAKIDLNNRLTNQADSSDNFRSYGLSIGFIKNL